MDSNREARCKHISYSFQVPTNPTKATYDASGNVLNDNFNIYQWNAESEIKSAAGVNYTYDGDGDRLEKSSGKIYWYGAGTEILDESDLSGNFTNEYVFFGGKRIARWNLTTSNSPTPGTGTATISGSEQTIPGTNAAPGTGSVTISGVEERHGSFSHACNCVVYTYDYGTASVTVNGHVDYTNYAEGSTSSSVASGLVTAINGDSSAVVTASASGSTVTLTAKTTGSSTNYTLSASVSSQNSFSPPSFSASPSGSTLTGGSNYSPTVYDSGNVWVIVNGFTASVSYGQGSTSATVASAIANVFNTNNSSPVTATVSGATLTVTAKTSGSDTNYPLSSDSASTQGSFSSASFTTATSGPALTGGTDSSSGDIYYYSEDMLGSSRTIVQAGTTSPCYDADFYPFGGERDVTASCAENHKFEGKERDSETQNDDFGARYYSWRVGRWLSADWSAVPAPVPYAHLSNPQTLNLYAMVSDNPETFADLDGHCVEDACFLETTAATAGLLQGLAWAAEALGASGAGAALAHYSDDIKSVGGSVLQQVGNWVHPISVGDVAPPPSTGSTTQTGTPGSTSQVGSVNTSPSHSQSSDNAGTIYVVPGSGTASGKPYVGRHNKPNPSKTRRSKDGRDRKQARVVRTYPADDTQAGRQAEQDEMDQQGGLPNLDNKRDEIRRRKDIPK